MIEFNQPLKNLTPWVDLIPQGLLDFTVNNICFDSREVKQGDAFFVLPSVAQNEQMYIDSAINQGASLIILSSQLNASVEHAETVKVEDPVQVAGDLLADLLYQNALDLQVVGITGTNGKSSISFYIAQLLQALECPSAVMGTLGYGHWDNLKPTGMTTLPLEQLHFALLKLSREFDAVAMEVSSHGLEQNRLAGVKFNGAVFSNLTRDHLDYHGTMEAYGAAKALLFKRPELQYAVINADDAFATELIKECSVVPVTYGSTQQADFRFEVIEQNTAGLNVLFVWNEYSQAVQLPLFGLFNVENVAAAILTCIQMGFEFSSIINACTHLQPVAGRMELVKVQTDQPMVLVDYAHTPDALEQILKATRKHVDSGQILMVVGCGGDRDQGKRPLMGKIACQFADKVFITSDNPRSENPEEICQQMVVDVENNFVIEVDRQKAIKAAIMSANNKDVVIIAGKGHEDYQEIQGQRHPFSDVLVAQAVLQEIQA